MAEYRREQRIQLSRAITNNETGNRQLKEFVDNRNCLVNHLSEVVQLHKPKRYVDFGYPMVGIPLGCFYEGKDRKKSNILGDSDDQGVQLGWSSIMSFTTEKGGLTNFRKILGPDMEVIEGQDVATYSTTQIVTRGVDSCTFIVVSDGKNHVTAHLDGGDTRRKEVLDSIIEVVPYPERGEPFPNIFISLVDDRQSRFKGRVTFAKALINYYSTGDLCSNLSECQITDDGDLVEALKANLTEEQQNHVQIFNRDMENKQRDNLQHPEIGVYLNDDDQLSIFGSLSHQKDQREEITGREKIFEFPLDPQIDCTQEIMGERRKCYLTTACVTHKGLADDCEELTVLRHFRDTYLINKSNGKDLIAMYYNKAPYILANIHKKKKEEEDMILESIYVIVRECVDAILNGDNEFAFRTYCDMVVKLDSEYGN